MTMSHKREPGSHFKRILSHTSAGSGNASGGSPAEFSSTKKMAKPRTGIGESDSSKSGNSYLLRPDHEHFLHQVQCANDGSKERTGKGFYQRLSATQVVETPRLDSICSYQDCPKDIMYETDIELTMSEEEAEKHQHIHPQSHRAFFPPGSPMGESVQPPFFNTRRPPKFWPVKQCSKASCDESTCLWHHSVLKLPHYVRWEDRTVTIELERKANESFGFNSKNKQRMCSEEIYVLVSKVEKDGKAAQQGLAVGDLILSANSVALQSKEKLSEISFKTQRKLRLQVQHPLEICSKAASYVEQLATSMDERRMLDFSQQGIPMAQPLSPSTSPSDAGFAQALSPSKENIPLNTLQMPSAKSKTQGHQLPQVRVFVCGSATNEFVRCLIGDFVNVHLDSRACCFQISMKKSQDGTVSIGNSESFSYLFRDSSESYINVELVSVADDSFFHHCCSWMFTPKSIFILTFDTKRLSLSFDTEMSRLCSLAHTVRTGVPGTYTNLNVYGIASVDTTVSSEEIRTLFYTSLGEQLPDPKIIYITDSTACDVLKQTQRDIFSLLSRICSKQSVILPTAIALDMLMSHRALTITKQDLSKILEEWNSESEQMGPESLHQVMEDVLNTRNLLITGSLNAWCTSENAKEFVLPSMLFEYLSRLAQSVEKDRITTGRQNTWLSLSTSGIVTRAEMEDMLSVCVSDPQKLLFCMEDLNMVFPVKLQPLDSGFGDTCSILFPYFLEDIPFNPNSADNFEKYITLEFSEDIPSSSFFNLLSKLSQNSDCQSFRMDAQFVSFMTIQGHDIYLYFVKNAKEIRIYKKRSGRLQGKNTISQQIQLTVSRQIANTVRIKLIPHMPETQTKAKAVESHPSNTEGAVGGQVETFDRSGADSIPVLPSQPIPVAEARNSVAAVQLPTDLIMGSLNEMPEAPMMNEEQQGSTELAVLNLRMINLRYIHTPLHSISTHLSVDNRWEILAAYLGLDLEQVALYTAMLPLNTSQLPASTFLKLYFKESRCTLGRFLQALLQMDYVCQQLAQDLWNAAFHGNHNLV